MTPEQELITSTEKHLAEVKDEHAKAVAELERLKAKYKEDGMLIEKDWESLWGACEKIAGAASVSDLNIESYFYKGELYEHGHHEGSQR